MPKFFDVYQLPHFRKHLFWNLATAMLIAIPATLFMHGVSIGAYSRFMILAIPVGIALLVAYPRAYRKFMQALANGNSSANHSVKVGIKTAAIVAFMTIPLYAIMAILFNEFDIPVNETSYFYTHPVLLEVVLIASIMVTSPLMGVLGIVVSFPAIFVLGPIFGVINYYALKNTPKATIDQALKLTETSPS